ncbi:hypothetical protein HZS_4289, partial [Henneguya salminicola]
IGHRKKYETENSCFYINSTIKDMINWTRGQPSSFNSLNKNEFWVYGDYKNFEEIFPALEYAELSKKINWGFVGYPNKCSKDTTLWIGTKGAYTPLHYDSYGTNFHVVLEGSKEWSLFNPLETKYILPTRIPYEESSVYSSLDLFDNKTINHLYEKVSPTKAIINAGDVLFVPRHWWHHVTCTSTTLSLNIWCENDEDKTERFKESLIKMIIQSWKQFDGTDTTEWLNPNEININFKQALNYINYSFQKLDQKFKNVELTGDKILDTILSDKVINFIADTIIENN